MNLPPSLWLLSALAWFPAAGAAASLAWGGFGTLSSYRHDAQGVRVRPDIQTSQAAEPDDWRWDGDSRFGVQGRWRADDGLEAVAQLEAGDADGRRWRPKLAWAYLQVQPLPRLSLRLGRQVLPTLQYSETRNVGHAQTAARPGPGVYQLNPGTPVDGVNATWEGEWQGGTVKVDLGGGRATLQRSGRRVDLRQSLSASLQWQRDALLLRASASRYVFDLQDEPLAGLVRSGLCANCAELQTGRLSNRDIRGPLVSVLAAWDALGWQASLEMLHRPRASSMLSPSAWGWQAQGSRRWGAWQVHAGMGETRFLERSPGLRATPGAPAAAVAQVTAVDRLLQTPQDLRSLQVGLRYDWSERVSTKFQQERWTALRDRETGRIGLVQLAAPPLAVTPSTWNGRVNLSTVSLDFVF